MRFGHENVTLRTPFSGAGASVAEATVGAGGCVGSVAGGSVAGGSVAGGKAGAGVHWASNRLTTVKTARIIIVLLFIFISLSSFDYVENVIYGGDFIDFIKQNYYHIWGCRIVFQHPPLLVLALDRTSCQPRLLSITIPVFHLLSP
jgi:hypothetical protein